MVWPMALTTVWPKIWGLLGASTSCWMCWLHEWYWMEYSGCLLQQSWTKKRDTVPRLSAPKGQIPTTKISEIVKNVCRMARTLVWPKVCSTWPMVWTTVWPTVCTTVWPIVWTTVWQWFFSFWPIVRRKSVQSDQYLSLGMVGLANASFAYGRSGQCLSWVADVILGTLCVDSIFILEYLWFV